MARETPGTCDRCGWRWPLDQLRPESIRGMKQDNKICPDCWDQDHPQNFLNQRSVVDKMVVEDARPDSSLFKSLFSWNPIGANTPSISVSVGRLRVTT